MATRVALARSVATALILNQDPFPRANAVPAPQPTIDLDTAAVEKAFGYAGKVNSGILQFSDPEIGNNVEGGMRNSSCDGHSYGD